MVDKKDRDVYLEKQPLDEAREKFLEKLKDVGFFTSKEEQCDVINSRGRVTSRQVRALRNSPHFRSSAMDGVAVRSKDTKGASKGDPKRIKRKDFYFVDTGEGIPDEFDSVIMIEEVNKIGPREIEIYQSTFPGQYIRPIGEDFKKEETVLPKNFKVTPEAVAALLNTGNFEIPVKKKPVCTFLPTGSELVSPEADLGKEKAPETNSHIFRGYIDKWGGEPITLPIVKDEYRPIKEAIEKVLPQTNLLAIGAGTSKGRKDYTARILEDLGEVLVHGVAYRPGHPVILGVVNNKPAVGVPGYPVAAWLCFQQFVKPCLEKYLGIKSGEELIVKGRLSKKIKSTLGLREFVRVKVEHEADKRKIIPLPSGSSKLSSLIYAQGILEVPENLEGLHKGELVKVRLF